MVSRIEPIKAVPNPTTLKSGVKLAASMSIKALIMKVNSPNVSKLTGRVNKSSSGFTNTFTKPMTMTASRAVLKSLISIPGVMRETINRARALMNHLMTIFSMYQKYTTVTQTCNSLYHFTPGMKYACNPGF
ncbi:MAG: hypothetical protein UV61_C0014G0017 [Candidatus Gottesmanbacteria bacterium GW2011_GWB1_43_11]|uniref:Uncharacterized protein n=1 Tax=Candidatus Gottesmanbacteria bacterium GW2011_GWB1_43_11 TaxID=1618446 RepID=A0A0G1CKA6_9BACT|nr:MAG: hypothetical protein UV04_C0041G0007 [Candidatus Gottesmanbacteria bacterium GW2011_GWA2_42_16]KKS53131.1 MAG: hypothetical protein UV17_C0040G0011 [Candidatus Gottesmanbacteria bacterium GW2011_GWA1_42_26]KKS81690.1 MAG: hypothetical protein UV55_C0010G0019 [Candidatus Gottesmanbacteria bacterium GW2011_GWC1_43_10]KKS85917.1 MAG: hypothetical protein UV61_C0014G0017 [Candidatus Gottesmanbacteria bacterium GW2011_GWB1_43_11]